MPEVADYDRAGGSRIQSEREPVQVMGSDIAGSIAAGGEYTFSYEPDYDMNVTGFRAPADLAKSFAIVGAKIGPVSVLAGGGAFPLDAFGPEGTLRVALALPITQKAQLKLTVRNITTGAVSGLFVGLIGKVKRAQ